MHETICRSALDLHVVKVPDPLAGEKHRSKKTRQAQTLNDRLAFKQGPNWLENLPTRVSTIRVTLSMDFLAPATSLGPS